MKRRDLLSAVVALTLPENAWARGKQSWAKSIELAGAPNLHQVSKRFFRSAQPTADGFANLESQLKIRSVLSLRSFHDNAELAAGTHLHLFRVPMNAFHVSADHSAGVVEALRIIKSELPKGRLLLHCQHGADRTGLITSLWRMLEQGWTAAEALDEMEHGGFNYHSLLFNIPHYLRSVDIEALRARVDA